MLEAYALAQLDGTAPALLAAHLSRCLSCRRRLAAIPVPIPTPAAIGLLVVSSRARLAMRSLACLAATLFALGEAFRPRTEQRTPSPDATVSIGQLVEAVGHHRLIEARLAGGFQYGPLVTTAGLPDQAALLRVAGEAKALATRGWTHSMERALAVAHTLLGQPEEAISILDRLCLADSHDASLRSDLAAALLLRSEHDNRADDLARAVDLAGRALEMQPNMPEALFNRALALDRLHLRKQALEGWQQVRHVEVTGPWAALATERMQTLTDAPRTRPEFFEREFLSAVRLGERGTLARLSHDSPDQAWDLLETRLLPALPASPDDMAPIARYVAALLGQQTGDHTLEVPRDLTRSFLDGLRQFTDGRVLFDKGHWRSADAHFALAQAQLEGSPLGLWAACWHGATQNGLGMPEEAVRITSQVAAVAREKGSNVLLGLALRVSAGARSARQDFASAAREYEDAFVAFEAAGLPMRAVLVRELSAELYQFLGDPIEAWRRRLPAFEHLDDMHERWRRFPIYLRASYFERASGRPHAARALLSELSAHADGDEADIISTLLERARTEGAIKASGGIPALQAARDRLATLPPEGIRSRLELDLADAEAALAVGLPTALPSINAAIALARRRSATVRLPSLLLRQAESLLRSHEPNAARRALAEAVDTFSAVRSLRDDLMIRWADEGFPAFEKLIEIGTTETRDTNQSLNLVERLFQLYSVGRGTSAADAEQRMTQVFPSATNAIAYVPTERAIYIYAFAPEPREFRVAVTSAMLSEEIRALNQTLGAEEDPSPHLRKIAAWLLAPVEGLLDESRPLALCLLGSAAEVPFAALPHRGRKLVDSFALYHAATPTAALAAGSPADAPQVIESIIHAVAPGGQHAPFLPNAADDVGRGPWRIDTLSLHKAANPRGLFVDALQRAHFLHFSGHALSNPDYPLLASLALGDSIDLRFSAADIARLNLVRRPVIVLGACQTAGGASQTGQGTATLAAQFVRAGAASVTANLWDMDDAAARGFFHEFYGALAAGLSPLRAVQQAQRRLSHRPLPEWAGWRTFLGRSATDPPHHARS